MMSQYNLLIMSRKTEVENNTHAETLSESSSIAATFELWGGDAIGSFSAQALDASTETR